MKITMKTLNERISNLTGKISKKENTIAKKELWVNKKSSKFVFSNDDYESINLWEDIKIVQEDIERLKKEISIAKESLVRYNEILSNEIKKDTTIINEIPETIKEMQLELVKNWDEWDIRRRDVIKRDYRKLDYQEFNKRYSARDCYLKDKTSKEIHDINVQLSKELVIDLYNRVKKITGEIIDWSHVYATQGACGSLVLNGYIVGKDGKAVIDSISAGGYNIQRLHVRVLVKEMNTK